MGPIWVVVGENSRAKIYTLKAINQPMQELMALTYPEARLHEQRLTSTLPGRSFDGTQQSNHAVGTDASPKQQAASQFAKHIVDYLETKHNQGAFAWLILIAAPDFLGLLRKHLKAPLRDKVTQEIDKNLVRQDSKAIQSYLIKTLPL